MNNSNFSLLLAVLFLELGSGLQGVLVPIRAELAGFPLTMIGSLGSVYYIGFVAGCVFLPQTVRRVGHIRAYAALAATAASAVLLHSLFVTAGAWLVFRALIGFCFAGLFMVTESWLNDRATAQTRGQILGIYMVVTWVGVIGGKMLFSAAPADASDLFLVTSIAVGLSLVPISLTASSAPSIIQPSRMTMIELYRIAPVGLVGCLVVGVVNGAFWTFVPLFAQARSESSIGVSLFISACVAGGALGQWPIGKVSDLFDRRWIIMITCWTAAAAGLAFVLQPEASDWLLLVVAAVFGSAGLSVYSICVAHANDRSDPSAIVDVSSHLLLAFGIGAIFGPFLAGLVISAAGVASLFLFTAMFHAVLGLFVFARTRAEKPVTEEERVIFAPHAPIGHSTQAVVELHPSVTQQDDVGQDIEESRQQDPQVS